MTHPKNIANLLAFSITMALTGCATGAIKGAPDRVTLVAGNPLAVAECVTVAMRRDPDAAVCPGPGIKLESYREVGQAMLTCSMDNAGLLGGPDEHPVYSAAFSGAEGGGTKVEIWAHTTLPGVRKYEDRVADFVEACGSAR